jgi:hypothetical protein
VSRGQNELIGKFRMAADYLISIGEGVGYETHTFQQELKGDW